MYVHHSLRTPDTQCVQLERRRLCRNTRVHRSRVPPPPLVGICCSVNATPAMLRLRQLEMGPCFWCHQNEKIAFDRDECLALPSGGRGEKRKSKKKKNKKRGREQMEGGLSAAGSTRTVRAPPCINNVDASATASAVAAVLRLLRLPLLLHRHHRYIE